MSRFDRTKTKTRKAQSLRSDMPNAEKALWKELRRKKLDDFKFRRQHPVGPYFLDFYCPEIKLCIELDGDQHDDEQARTHDSKRTEFLKEKGVLVLRFWNNDVYENLEGVLEAILEQALYLKREQEIQHNAVPSPCKGEG